LDFDLGSCGPLLVDVPGATLLVWLSLLARIPSVICLIVITWGNQFAVAQSSVDPGNSIIQAAVTYRTEQGTYVAFRATKEKLSTFRITATNPPTILSGWSATRTNGGCGSPFVTTTDGSSNPIVWVMGTAGWGIEGDQRLHGYDGETGAVVYAGGGPNELIPGTHTYSTTGIVARGHIYIAGDNKVYAFRPSRPNPIPSLVPRRILGQRCMLVQCGHFLAAIKDDAQGSSKNAVSFPSARNKSPSVVAVRIKIQIVRP
jgi:hypothetical protein